MRRNNEVVERAKKVIAQAKSRIKKVDEMLAENSTVDSLPGNKEWAEPHVEWYLRFLDTPPNFNPKEWNAMKGYAPKGAKLPRHKHNSSERVIILQGVMFECESKQTLNCMSEPIWIPADTWHSWEVLEDCFYIVQFKPPIGVRENIPSEEIRACANFRMEKT